MDDYQKFIAVSKYARWIEEEGRRETWEETVDRYISNVVEGKLSHGEEELLNSIREGIKKLSITPSMRAMMTAGPPLDRDNTCAYNCAYLPVDNAKSFDEAMFILLCGTGVGFSVERQFVSKLPQIPSKLFDSETTVVVKDSKEGWAKGLRQLLALLFSGEIPKWDTSQIRPMGARLKTFGGRASGPAPLIDLFNFVVETFKEAKGRNLSSIECHDIMCKIGDIVVSGGVRRSAMISLSNLSDDRMRHAKTGVYPEHRALANNSVCYTEKPDAVSFLREWTALAESGSGERGVFNRQAAKAQAGKSGRRDTDYEFGTNPCSEIILRPYQFCNLTEVVVRREDTIKELEKKVELATILGTIQSTYTKFPYLRKIWEKNTEEERLLGVSFTGIMDNPLMTTKNKGLEKTLDYLKTVAINTNKIWAKKLGIPQSTAITCVKPSGTVSQLVNSSSGIHARYSPYYIRTVRGNNLDPMTQFMIDQGVINEPCVYKGDSTTVFSFPIKAPKGAVVTKDLSALDQLETWMVYQEHWCEHKPSTTINVRPDEWFEVGAYVYENFDKISGVSFLPYDDHVYQQPVYEEVWKTDYENFVKMSPRSIDWEKLSDYEKEDKTVAMQSLACSSGICEVVDIG